MGFLPTDEQRFYDSCVDGLRRAGWSRSEAEGEALNRIEAMRQRKAEKVCKPHGRPYAWPHAVGCTECCRLAAEDADPGMAPNGGFWA